MVCFCTHSSLSFLIATTLGVVPMVLCQMSSLSSLSVSGKAGAVTCHPDCLSTVTVRNIVSNGICTSNHQFLGLCGLARATNVAAVLQSGWQCTSANSPIGDVCSWPGVQCESTYSAISLTNPSISGFVSIKYQRSLRHKCHRNIADGSLLFVFSD